LTVNSVSGVLIPDAASVSNKENIVETAPGLTNRLLKNAHLRRCPHPSPCQARGGLVVAYIQVRLTPQHCLPDRQVKSAAGALHLGIFEQLEKKDFFNRLLIPLEERWPSVLVTI
jgi:hypothetical protein